MQDQVRGGEVACGNNKVSHEGLRTDPVVTSPRPNLVKVERSPERVVQVELRASAEFERAKQQVRSAVSFAEIRSVVLSVQQALSLARRSGARRSELRRLEGDLEAIKRDASEREGHIARDELRLSEARRLVDEAFSPTPDRLSRRSLGVRSVAPTEPERAPVLDAHDIETIVKYVADEYEDERFEGWAYEALNGALWDGPIEGGPGQTRPALTDVSDFSHDLSRALKKLPPYKNTVQRGSNPNYPIEFYRPDRYEPGTVVVENGFVSASKNPQKAFEGPILWIIESKSGRDIEKLSPLGSRETEVLFDHFSRFFVTTKEWRSDVGPSGTLVIHMEQMED